MDWRMWLTAWWPYYYGALVPLGIASFIVMEDRRLIGLLMIILLAALFWWPAVLGWTPGGIACGL